MGSSNRHWPSMFKSKPCNHHEFNSPHFSSSPPCKSLPNFPSPDGSATSEERTPEPKPRWNPKPEQIRILEAIFNSGMVNPPREEIKKIRGQLQEYGQVGDANVFYWFQNRKSRSKQKNRQLLHKSSPAAAITPQTPPLAPVAPSSSSSSSSDRSSPNKLGPLGSVLESSTGMSMSVNNNHPGYSFHQHQNDAFLHQEVDISPPAALPFFFPVQHNGGFGGGGLSYNEIMPPPPPATGGGELYHSFSSEDVHPVVADQGTFSGLLLGDMMGASRRSMFQEDEDKLSFQGAEELSFMVTNPTNTNTINVPPSSASPHVLPSLSQSQFQGAGDPCGGGRMVLGSVRSTVFINDVSFEVPAMGPFNLREVFGEDVVMLHQSGHPVPTNEWGLTLHPLQQGSCYYLARTVAPKHHHSTTTPHHGLLLPASEFSFQL